MGRSNRVQNGRLSLDVIAHFGQLLLPMKLAAYLEINGLTQALFAESIGVSVFAVGKYVRGERVPRPRILARIRAQTGGEVTANDFLSDLAADCPTERAA